MERIVYLYWLGVIARRVRRARQGLWPLLSAAVVLAVLLGGPATAFAMPPEPIEEPVDPIDDYMGGFNWTVLPRFGNDADGNGVIDYATDPAYVNAATLAVKFKGCPPSGQGNTYAWEIDGAAANVTACEFTHNFTAGQHHVKFTLTPSSGPSSVYEEDILVRDILIVSLGDSFGSGEGNPDVPQQFDPWTGLVTAGAKWVDRRCHRSAYAGAAQAALALENADPHSSVTFVSLACSGAELIHVGYVPYDGAEPGPGDDTPVDPQIDALRQIVGQRPIDALVISGGGNDIGFGEIIQDCIAQAGCHTLGWITSRLEAKMNGLLGLYNGLTYKIALGSDGDGPEPGLDVANVYFTEYPNLVRDTDGDVCDSILGEIVPGLSMDKQEAAWAESAALQPLNATMHQAVQGAAVTYPAIGWHYVDGMDAAFAGPGYGHGYCAADSWVRRIHPSAIMQGPLLPTTAWFFIPVWELQNTVGTMHPTEAGHQVYRDRLLAYMLPDLYPTQPPAGGPTFSAVGAIGSNSNVMGNNGWVIQSSCYPGCALQAVLEVTATDPAGIIGTGVSINGQPGCSVTGIFCSGSSPDPQHYVWRFSFLTGGIHRLEFSARNSNNQVANYTHELKVDLNNPYPSIHLASEGNYSAGWYGASISVTLAASDAPGALGSGAYGVDYILDGVPGQLIPSGEILVTGDGPHTLNYQAVDMAGRRSDWYTRTMAVDTTDPVFVCGEADGLWHADDVTIACTASDSGSGLGHWPNGNFVLFTFVSTGTETANAWTSGQTICDGVSNCVVAGPVFGNKVDKAAPTISLNAPAATTYLPNQVVAADYSCADGGSGVASCAGPVASGSALDTSTPGNHSFTVNATDNVGNAASQSASYDVTYDLCLLYDDTKAHRQGSTVPIRLQLCDANGANLSAADIVLTATELVKQDNSASGDPAAPGNSNPDNNFRFEEEVGSYRYNLSTAGLSSGTWALHFTVSGDPLTHTVFFDVR